MTFEGGFERSPDFVRRSCRARKLVRLVVSFSKEQAATAAVAQAAAGAGWGELLADVLCYGRIRRLVG
jgi:hypothetical protein